MLCEPKGALDRSLIVRITAAHFPNQSCANVRPHDELDEDDHPADNEEYDEPEELNQGVEEENEVDLLLQHQKEIVEYVYGGASL